MKTLLRTIAFASTASLLVINAFIVNFLSQIKPTHIWGNVFTAVWIVPSILILLYWLFITNKIWNLDLI